MSLVDSVPKIVTNQPTCLWIPSNKHLKTQNVCEVQVVSLEGYEIFNLEFERDTLLTEFFCNEEILNFAVRLKTVFANCTSIVFHCIHLDFLY